MTKVVPNARTKDEYLIAGGALKIRFKALRGPGGWLDYSPANLEIEFNGQPVEACQGVELVIGKDGVPRATLKFNLTELDVDSDVLSYLQAYVEEKG